MDDVLLKKLKLYEEDFKCFMGIEEFPLEVNPEKNDTLSRFQTNSKNLIQKGTRASINSIL